MSNKIYEFLAFISCISSTISAQDSPEIYLERTRNVELNESSGTSVLSYRIPCSSEFDARSSFLPLTTHLTYTEPKSLLYDNTANECQVMSFSSPDSQPQYQIPLGNNSLTLYKDICTSSADTVTRRRCPLTHESQAKKDCQEYFENGYTADGIYTLKLNETTSIDAWCEFDADNGWTVILHRDNSSVNFDRYWDDYKYGFGDLNSEYWIGNEHIHLLTKVNGNNRLIIHREEIDTHQSDLEFSSFSVSNEEELYRLEQAVLVSSTTFSNCSADATGLAYHVGHSFSTRDRENDNHESVHCAEEYDGGWWFDACLTVHLLSGRGMYWICSGIQDVRALKVVTMRVTRT